MNIYTSLLQRNSNFRTLWLASVVTMLGDWFNTIGTIVLINRYTDSGLAIAALFLARMVPPFLFSPVAGLVADRFNRKAVMLLSDLLRIGIVLGFLLVDSPSEAWLVYGLTALQFIVATFYHPAHAAILPSVVDNKEDLLVANTLGSITWSAMLALGAALGGVTTALFGVQTALLIDAVTFAISAALVAQVITPQQEVQEQSQTNDDGFAIWGGIRYALEHPGVGAVTLVKALGSIGSTDVIMTALASSLFIFGVGGAGALGMMMTAAGIGAVLGPLIANRFTPETNTALQRSIVIGFAASAVGWIVVGQVGFFWLVLFGFLLRGMGSSTNWTYSSVLLQMNVPDHMLGRVFALDEMIRTLTASVAIWLAGYAMDSLDMTAQSLASFYGLATILPMIIWGWHAWYINQPRQERTVMGRQQYLST
ncbi:MAG: MFS transporter [Chloroflexota bacterium]